MFTFKTFLRAATVALPLVLTGALWAQTPPAPAPDAPAPAMFPFVIPWDDASPGTATDVSFLNTVPAGAHGYIVARGGHFVESGTGKRVRFLGVSFAGQDAFPDHADAEKVAARIAKYGINIVRLHHMDNDDWGQNAHIWDDSFPDRRHISAVQLDKLDYFIAQLKKNGVYVDINLHVSRQFHPADGFPASVDQISFGYDKRVDNYDRQMIALQKEYARQLLAHVNPYTHLSYAEDPCVATVEINNENSLVGDPWANLGADLTTLPEPFRGELVGFWNDWLQKKYGSDADLKAAWLKGVTPPGPSIVPPDAAWSDEHQGTSQGTMTPAPADANAAPGTAPPLTETITAVDGTDWHVQAHVTGLDFHNGDTYTVTFRAKADAPRPLPVAASLDEADWHNVGLQDTAALTTDWKQFQYIFQAHDTVPNHGRIAFTLGGKTGTVDIADLQVKPGAEGAGVQPGQSLAAKTIDIPLSGTRTQRADWLEFLADTERAYADEMRDYLQNELHVHANIIDSQISWGGLSGPNREANMDFADNHAYWQHPSFPGKPWDGANWNIPNTPMVADLANGGGGTLESLAEYRIAGKPYSISEYNEPAPNDYQCEAVPELATFGAFQDWDMLYLFDYGDYGAASTSNDKIDGYFGVGSNPAKWAFFPAAALIFRGFEMPPAGQSVSVAPAPHGWDTAFAQGMLTAADAWKTLGRPAPFLQDRLSLNTGHSAHAMADGTPTTLTVSKTASGPLYVADSPGAVAIIGYVGGQSITTKAGLFTFPQFGDNFAAVTLTPLDGKPIASSRHLLLTAVGKVENQDMQWNATRTSVENHWGHGPTMAEGIPMTVTLMRNSAFTGHVYALDAMGKRAGEVQISGMIRGLARADEPQFSAGPQYQTVWYEITE